MTLLLALCMLQEPEAAVVETLDLPASPLLDLDRLEWTARAGVAVFGPDFEADPEGVAGLSLRCPLPWLSRDVLGLSHDPVGLFAEATWGSIERDILGEDREGRLFFGSLGLDATWPHASPWRLRLGTGVQLGRFGGVEGLDDGAAFLVVGSAGLEALGGVLSLEPQLALGRSGDAIGFLFLGFSLTF